MRPLKMCPSRRIAGTLHNITSRFMNIPPTLAHSIQNEKKHREWWILLACGSFSPITNAHLRIFEDARNVLEEKDKYVAAGFISPVHVNYGKASLMSVSSEDRLYMCQEATKSSNWINVWDWELKQPDFTKTVVALDNLQAQLRQVLDDNDRQDVNLRVCLLSGADLLLTFLDTSIWNPEHVERILTDFGVVCLTRHDSDIEYHLEREELFIEHRDHIVVVYPAVYNSISSSAVRALLGNGQSAAYLVPDSVLSYIEEQGLYNCRSDQHVSKNYMVGF